MPIQIMVRRSMSLAGTFFLALASLLACSSKTTDTPDAAVATCSQPGGEVSGPADTQCMVDGGLFVQSTTTAACNICTSDGGDTEPDIDAGPDAGCYTQLGYGPPSFGTSASTEGCKYAVSWTSTPICENAPVYFTVVATHLSDGTPVTGGNAQPDVTLDCDHAIPNLPAEVSPENPPGTYKVGPIIFDEPGQWIVRFHLYPDCCRLVPESMHDHASFWVNVP